MRWPLVTLARFQRVTEVHKSLSDKYAKAESDALLYLERAVKAEAKAEAKDEMIAGLQRELMRARASLDVAETRHTELVTRLVAPHPGAIQPGEIAHMDEATEDLEWEARWQASEAALAAGRPIGPLTDEELAREMVRHAGGLATETESLYE